MALAVVFAAWFIVGTVSVLQRNYGLQHNIESKQRQLTLAELQVQTLEFESDYYQSNEYKELTARQHFGLALPGEKLLILPPNSAKAIANSGQVQPTVSSSDNASDMSKWLDFLSGKSVRLLQ